MRNLGLVGGLGPVATVHYYRELAKSQAGEILLVHAEITRVMGMMQQGDVMGLTTYLARLIERLAKGGADLAAVSAVTPHFCIRELKKVSALPLVDIVEEVDQEIQRRGYRSVALFGTRFVVESRLFGMLQNVEVLVPDQVPEIHDAYMQAVRGSTDGRAVLSRIARDLPVDAIVLAGTDLVLLFDETNTDFPHLDCTRLHIDAILRELRA